MKRVRWYFCNYVIRDIKMSVCCIGLSTGLESRRLQSPFCHGSWLGNLGPVTLSEMNIAHRVVVRIKYKKIMM